jgi:hypothetical protein
MFTLLQEQHKVQLKSMAAANKQAMDTMLEHMNVIPLLAISNTGHAFSSMKRNRKKCTTHGKHVFSIPEDCY